MDDSHVLPFTGREDGRRKRGGGSGGPPDDGDADGVLIAKGNVYASVCGQREAVMLEFIRQDGHSFSVPYHRQPLIWWHPPDTIILEYPGIFSVLLRGKNLEELHGRINDRRVTWVRECDDSVAAALPMAVTRIEIIRAYPSHSEGIHELSTPPPTPA
jgi:hypothetical protein